MTQPISSSAAIKLSGLTATHVTQSGQVLTDVPGMLKLLGYGDTNDPANCQWVLQELANAYLNAYRAKHMVAGTPPTETDFDVFNACPLSGRIFAGKYKNTVLNHLDPSYTITAMLIAQAEANRAGEKLPTITLCYYDAPVYAEGVKVMATITAV